MICKLITESWSLSYFNVVSFLLDPTIISNFVIARMNLLHPSLLKEKLPEWKKSPLIFFLEVQGNFQLVKYL